jgi:methyl-accepting chemotaxis protein
MQVIRTAQPRDLSDFEEASIKERLDSVQTAASAFALLMILASAVAILFSIGVSVVIIKYVKSTLGAEPEEVADAIRRLANGELNQSIITSHPNSVMGILRSALARLGALHQRPRISALATNLKSSNAISPPQAHPEI